PTVPVRARISAPPARAPHGAQHEELWAFRDRRVRWVRRPRSRSRLCLRDDPRRPGMAGPAQSRSDRRGVRPTRATIDLVRERGTKLARLTWLNHEPRKLSNAYDATRQRARGHPRSVD